MVATEPKTGEILAMVGSKVYFDDEIDGQVNVTIRPRQPGSSFKPIVYATSFLEGYTPETILYDVNLLMLCRLYHGESWDSKSADRPDHER